MESNATPRAQLKHQLGDQVDAAYRSSTPASVEDAGLYLFASFDLVAATQYKELDPVEWPVVISHFYEFILSGAETRLGEGSRLWKLVGDEVLLYRRVSSVEDLRRWVTGVYAITDDTGKRLHFNYPKTNPALSVKSAAWCARMHHVRPQKLKDVRAAFRDHGYRNIIIPELGVPERGGADSLRIDFLGADVDIGFRIARHVPRQHLVVSADLAHLLFREWGGAARMDEHLRIVGYEPLRGVWGGRHYPIIWYAPSWNDPATMFAYDDRFDYPLVERVLNGREEPIKVLGRIYDDLNRTGHIKELHQYVRTLSEVASEEDNASPRAPAVRSHGVEVHCAAVCFRRDTGRVLLAQRPSTKRRYPSHWEFGCAKLAEGESFEDALCRAYKEDFGAMLSFPGGNARPVATYLIPDGHIPGIIFVAEITNPEAVTARRHERLEWVDPAHSTGLPIGEHVPDMEATLRGAHDVWNRLDKIKAQPRVA